MKTALPRLSVLLALGLLLGGCASFDAEAPRGARGLAGLQRFFVVTNSNDNHALAQHITAALQARGLTVDSGPLTMMPDNTQILVNYVDRWEWDFGEHLYFLKISARNPDADDILAAATFSAKVPLNETLPDTVGKLVTRLLSGKNTAPPPASAPADQDQGAGAKRRSH